jgi:hypothetical protein
MFFLQNGNITMSFFPPVNYSIIGYANLTVRNPDGGWSVVREQMFFTDDCPFVGAHATQST